MIGSLSDGPTGFNDHRNEAEHLELKAISPLDVQMLEELVGDSPSEEVLDSSGILHSPISSSVERGLKDLPRDWFAELGVGDLERSVTIGKLHDVGAIV